MSAPEATNWSQSPLQLNMLSSTYQGPYLVKSCNIISSSHSIYHMSNFPNNDQHSPNLQFIPVQNYMPLPCTNVMPVYDK